MDERASELRPRPSARLFNQVARAQESLTRTRAGFRRVTCDYEEGALVLCGRVHSFFLKQLAAACARQAVDGRLPIINRLHVG